MEETGEFNVALVTCARYSQLVADDTPLLLAGMTRQGLGAHIAVWDDPSVDWSHYTHAVVRSTWDYSLRRDEFLAWTERVAALTLLWNSPRVVKWNSHKRYLQVLAESGIPTIPTEWLEVGDTVDLNLVMALQGWPEVVVKPTVNAGARETVRVSQMAVRDGQAHLDRLLPQREMMVQPFVSSILTEGELSLVFIGGQLSHAIRKRPADGDYRIQEKFGGRNTVVVPSADERQLAESALAAVGAPLLYGRVDLVRGPNDQLYVIELELIEPSWYLNLVPDRIEAAIAAMVDFWTQSDEISQESQFDTVQS